MSVEYTKNLAASMRAIVDEVFKEEWIKHQTPDYYAKRKYGKWTIYNREGWRVAHGLNEKEKNNYMKLLENNDGD